MASAAEVRHDEVHARFLVDHGDGLSLLQYRKHEEPRVMHMIRTFVAPAHRNRGWGAVLVEAALEHARAEGYRVTSSCWFVDAYLDEHPEYAALRG